MLFVSVSIKNFKKILDDTDKHIHIHIVYLTLWDDTFSEQRTWGRS